MQSSQSSGTSPVSILCTQFQWDSVVCTPCTALRTERHLQEQPEPSRRAHSSFALTFLQWLHTRQFSHNPVIFPLAYKIAAWNVVSHRTKGIKGPWEYVQAEFCRCLSICGCCNCAITSPVTTVVKVCYFRAGRLQIPNFQTIGQVQNSKNKGGPSTKRAMNLFQSFPQSHDVPAQSTTPKAVTFNGWQYHKLLILHGLYLGSPAFLFDSTLGSPLCWRGPGIAHMKKKNGNTEL